MIPKNLFFMWLGDNPPSYCEFAINAFKEVNPDFNIEFIRKDCNELDNFENSKDELLKMSCKYVLNNKKNKYHQNIHNFYVSVSNTYRMFLIKKYGGIYLDCDTFPVKPFSDGNILNLDCFYQCTTLKDNGLTLFPDIFHMGCPKQTNMNDKIKHKKLLYPPHILYCYIDNEKKNTEWWTLHDKFYNCTLAYGEYMHDIPGKYIEHFKHLSWVKGKRVEKSIYDKQEN